MHQIAQMGTRDVEVMQVVRTRLERRGKGTDDGPVRRIEQFWSMGGELLAEVDPIGELDA